MALTKEELTDVRTAWQRLNRATSYLVGPIFDGTPESRSEVGRLVDECRQALTIILLTSGPDGAIDLEGGEKLDLEMLRHRTKVREQNKADNFASNYSSGPVKGSALSGIASGSYDAQSCEAEKAAKTADKTAAFVAAYTEGTRIHDVTVVGAGSLKQKAEAETLNRVRTLAAVEEQKDPDKIPLSEIPLLKRLKQAALARKQDPPWTNPDASVKLWLEDDATPGTEGHEYLSDAWERLFAEKFDGRAALEQYDAGDAVYALFSGGRVAIASYPGNSEIRRLK